MTERTVLLLRELENLLAAVQISVTSGIAPHAGINCAREIMRDLLLSLDLQVDPSQPPIHDMDLESDFSR